MAKPWPSYNQRMIDVYQDYFSKNVKFIFVNANRSEPAGEVREHAKRVGFPFSVMSSIIQASSAITAPSTTA